MRSLFKTAAVSAAALTAACATMPSASHELDRAGLIAATDAYIASLVAHDPTMAPLSPDVTIVENIKQIEPGDGLWDTANGAPTTFAIHVPDPERQTAGFLGVMQADNQPKIVAFRLKFENGAIVEAEHLISGIRPQMMANLATPRPGLLAEVPPAEREPHDELIKIGATYYDALDDNDGSLSPFAADCERHENGMITASYKPAAAPVTIPGQAPPPAAEAPIARDCAGQLTSQAMAYIDSLDNRRVFAADPVTGLAMGLSHFRHSMTRGAYQVTALDGSKVMRNPNFAPFDLPAAHIFKIQGGQIHEIEAMGFQAPYNSPTGWEK